MSTKRNKNWKQLREKNYEVVKLTRGEGSDHCTKEYSLEDRVTCIYSFLRYREEQDNPKGGQLGPQPHCQENQTEYAATPVIVHDVQPFCSSKRHSIALRNEDVPFCSRLYKYSVVPGRPRLPFSCETPDHPFPISPICHPFTHVYFGGGVVFNVGGSLR